MVWLEMLVSNLVILRMLLGTMFMLIILPNLVSKSWLTNLDP